jgi:hypothetical protein
MRENRISAIQLFGFGLAIGAIATGVARFNSADLQSERGGEGL